MQLIIFNVKILHNADCFYYICALKGNIAFYDTNLIIMDSKFDFKSCLSLLHDCTSALYTHADDLSDEDFLFCDFLKYACMRYTEVYTSEIRVMYRTSSILKDSPNTSEK